MTSKRTDQLTWRHWTLAIVVLASIAGVMVRLYQVQILNHEDYLEQAATLGKTLVVGVNSDRSIRNLGKGDDRPYNNQLDRMLVVAGLSAVDVVVGFDDETPIELIRAITPDCLVKGGDWPVDQIVGADWVREHGGTVRSLPIRYQRSTTALADRIKAFHNLFAVP